MILLINEKTKKGILNRIHKKWDEIMTKEYPMTYEEYEKKVIELYLDGISEDHKEMIKERIDNLLENDPTFLSGLYGDTCFRYDRPDIYGENCKRAFEDEKLKDIPVRTLDMFVGGD